MVLCGDLEGWSGGCRREGRPRGTGQKPTQHCKATIPFPPKKNWSRLTLGFLQDDSCVDIAVPQNGPMAPSMQNPGRTHPGVLPQKDKYMRRSRSPVPTEEPAEESILALPSLPVNADLQSPGLLLGTQRERRC